MMSTKVQRSQRPGTKPVIRQKLEEARVQSIAFELEATSGTLTTDLGDLDSEVTTLQGTVGGLEAVVIDLDTRVSTLEP